MARRLYNDKILKIKMQVEIKLHKNMYIKNIIYWKKVHLQLLSEFVINSLINYLSFWYKKKKMMDSDN